MISITRLLLGLDSMPGSGFLCAVSGLIMERSEAISAGSLARLPFVADCLSFRRCPDENHRGRPVDPNLRPPLPEAVLLQRRHPHWHLQNRGAQAAGVRGERRQLVSRPQSATFTEKLLVFSFHWSEVLICIYREQLSIPGVTALPHSCWKKDVG